MFQGTTIYFSQGLPCLEGISIIIELMRTLGAQPRILGGEKGLYSLKGCSQRRYVSWPSHEAILKAETVYFCYDSQIEKVCGARIDSTYNFTYNTQENVWRMSYDTNLFPPAIDYAKGNDGDGEPSKYNYKLSEVLKFYDLVKYLHLELESKLTAGSCQDDYMQFGEDEDQPGGYDSVLRFDKSGRCRLIAPYEERRDIVQEDLDFNNWCLDSKEPVEIKVSAEFSAFLKR